MSVRVVERSTPSQTMRLSWFDGLYRLLLELKMFLACTKMKHGELSYGCDLDHVYLCGTMEALYVPMADTPVVTFWEGKIVDTKNYTFYTGKWQATMPEDDIRHWTKFPSFSPLLVRLLTSSLCRIDGGKSLDLSSYHYIFMYFVNVGTDCGLTVAVMAPLVDSIMILKQYSSTKKSASIVSSEPACVLDTRRSPSPPTSTSTLSLSLGGSGGSGGGGCSSETICVAAVSGNPSTKWPPSSSTPQQENISSNAAVVESSQGGGDIVGGGGGSGGGGGEVVAAGIRKCGMGMEDWESVLSEPAAVSSPGQEQSILRLIMGDVEDLSMGLSKLLQSGGVGMDFDFNGGAENCCPQQ
ncbi:LOW QUALITY PROTEIN: Vacuolar import/degradation protein Vid24 [Dillenia turbinata]|uniref:Vacuolar import/degradation protein Vid24 n=1 Tax=Dillenia turbinata TaxID=194707 RepID=A0AAN8WAK1_9MAGN